MDYLDDHNPIAIGRTDQIEKLACGYDGAIVSIGNNELRQQRTGRLLKVGASVVSLVHQDSYVAASAKVGIGSVVLPGAVIHTNAKVGIGCIISNGALIDHDAAVEDFSHINSRAIFPRDTGETTRCKQEQL